MTGGRSRSTILCVGRLYCDVIFTDVPRLPSMGTEVFAGGVGLHAGGGAFITAAWLASLGHRAELASHLPNAPFHDVVVAELKAARLGLGLCRPLDPALDTQLTVAIASDSDRAFLTRRSGAAAPDITADDLRRIGARHIHIGELSTLLERPDLVALAREVGATVSLDCAWDDDLPVAQVASHLARVDVFLPNDAEVRHLVDRGVAEPFSALTVVKKGANGSSASTAGGEISEPAEPVHVVDTTGAGDAFNAGFLHAWLDGLQIASCLAAGVRVASIALGRAGGAGRLPCLAHILSTVKVANG